MNNLYNYRTKLYHSDDFINLICFFFPQATFKKHCAFITEHVGIRASDLVKYTYEIKQDIMVNGQSLNVHVCPQCKGTKWSGENEDIIPDQTQIKNEGMLHVSLGFCC